MKLIAAVALGALVSLAACAGAEGGSAKAGETDMHARLFPSAWVVTAIDGQPAVAGRPPTLAFDEEGRAFGNASCNRFAGSASVSGSTLRFTPFAVTKMACLDPALGAQETAYLQALSQVETAAFLPEGGLELRGESAVIALAPEPLTITGSVTYRQRIALPPGAQLEVRIEDVSLADAPAVTLSERILPIETQVPIAFEISVDRAKLQPGRRYGLRASITLDGRLLFTTDTYIAVPPENGGDRIDIVLVAVGAP